MHRRGIMRKKVLFYLLVFVFLFTCIVSMQVTNRTFDEKNASARTNFNNQKEVGEEYLKTINNEDNVETSVSSTKLLKDLNDKEYTLFECEPTGYMILCNDSNSLVEYSLYSLSPYLNHSNNLYYFGPAEFYILDGDNFVHLLSNQIIPRNSHKTIDSIKNYTNKMYSSLLNEFKNTVETKGIKHNTVRSSWTYVNNHRFFTTKTSGASFSYYSISNGVCGYIAASILLGYYDQYVKRCVPDNYMQFNNHGYKEYKYNNVIGSGEFTQHLLTFRNNQNNYSSTSTTIRTCLTNYFNHYNYTDMGIYDMITPFFSSLTMKNLINKSTPVILFGLIADPATSINNSPDGDDGHAVVVYGYKKKSGGGYEFMVHYGWPGYSQVAINNNACAATFGSMLRLKTVN